MKMKRVAALLLAAMMATNVSAVSVFAEDAEGGTQRISEETINLTVSGRNDFSDNIWNDTVQFAEYESRLGLKFDATTYLDADWPSQVSLMFASDELPDMFANAKFTSQEVAKYGSDGYFLDLAEYLDIMPNLAAFFEEYPEYYAACKDSEGHIYALPQINVNPPCAVIGDPTYIRKDWCENLGLEVPTSLDELYNVLLAFKEQDADGDGDPNNEIPFLYRPLNGIEQPMMRSFGIYSNNKEYPLVLEDGKIVLANSTDNYKAYLTYMNKLYADGLMNQDAFVITEEEKLAVQQNGSVGMFAAYSNFPAETGRENAEILSLVPSFTGEYNEEQVVVLGSKVGTEYKWAVNAQTEYPEELAKFIDYLFTEEGIISARFGYEGSCFVWKDVAGIQLTDQTPLAEKWEGETSFNFHVWVVNGFNMVNSPLGGSWDLLDKVSDEELLSDEVRDFTGINVLREEMLRSGVKQLETLPSLSYTEEEQKRRTILYTDITTYLGTSTAEFISGAKDIENDWDAYLAELNSMGLEELIAIEQAAYDRYVASFN